MSARPVKTRQSDTAYEGLRLAIVRTELAPGAPIDERDCMEMLGVGRTPLREALQRLVQEDLVVSVPQRGYFVAGNSTNDFFQLQEFRLHSEILAARMAAVRITPSQLAELETLFAEARAGVADNRSDIHWHLDIDERMHRLVAEASGNSYLMRTLNRLFALSVRSLYLSRVPVTLISDELTNFDAIYQALRAHDPDAAESAMRQHLSISTLSLAQSAQAAGADYQAQRAAR